MSEAPEVRVKKGRRKKDKKTQIEISLYVNGIAYEFGVICGFCTKEKAVFHCPLCPEFYCAECDTVTHAVKKRKDHIRKALAKYTKDEAAKKITHAVRYHGHLRMLQMECKKVFRRYFDRVSLNHYYYNPIYKTTSWRKPYCLRKHDLVPYIEPDTAAARIQTGLYRTWQARVIVNEKLKAQYRKLFDRNRGLFYYAYMGQSKLIPKQSWKKPKYFGKRGYIRDITAVFTSDIAAIVIQRKWKANLIRRFFYALVRSTFDQQWDAIHGRFTYYHREREMLYENKPLLLGSQPWDPNYVPDWEIDKVKQCIWK